MTTIKRYEDDFDIFHGKGKLEIMEELQGCESEIPSRSEYSHVQPHIQVCLFIVHFFQKLLAILVLKKSSMSSISSFVRLEFQRCWKCFAKRSGKGQHNGNSIYFS